MTFRICKTCKTRAGIATDSVERDGCAFTVYADTADEAVARARFLMPWLPTNLVAVPESN